MKKIFTLSCFTTPRPLDSVPDALLQINPYRCVRRLSAPLPPRTPEERGLKFEISAESPSSLGRRSSGRPYTPMARRVNPFLLSRDMTHFKYIGTLTVKSESFSQNINSGIDHIVRSSPKYLPSSQTALTVYQRFSTLFTSNALYSAYFIAKPPSMARISPCRAA